MPHALLFAVFIVGIIGMFIPRKKKDERPVVKCKEIWKTPKYKNDD